MALLMKGDCLEVMATLPDGSIDAIITDPPYGTIKGMGLGSWDDKTTGWDEVIPHGEMMKQCARLLRQGGALVLFSQDPYSSKLTVDATHDLPFSYRYLWLKNNFANALLVNKAPVKYTEDINVFFKNHDSCGVHPLREYFKMVFGYIGLGKKEVLGRIGQRACHVFRFTSPQFTLCTSETYDALVSAYSIDGMAGFVPYGILKGTDGAFKAKVRRVFNLPEGKKFKSNVLEYAKPSTSVHPTQKPVELMEDLIKTYTHEGHTVLDFTMGSGSTGVAAVGLKRNFIGIERDDEHFETARGRITQAEADVWR
jgi:site-specific DNA-methyltransferase (adenine-specific)